jgi:3-ketosteroid 9alpha-monooxygenase subunit A
MNASTQTAAQDGSQDEPSPFVGFPRGWFVVGYSGELGPGEVKALRYFDQDLVMWRGEDGGVRILDAHCCHLGAHLGHGGTVEGNDIRCPFHAWEFDGAGTCTKVPYAKKIPPKAGMRAWKVEERNGLILLAHGRDGVLPDWQLPEIEDHASEGWTPWIGKLLFIKTQPYEVMENLADSAHFIPVHGTHVDAFRNEFDGHVAHQFAAGIAYPRGGGEDKFEIQATYHGPAIQLSTMNGVLKSRLLLAHTPIDDSCLHLRFAVSLKRLPGQDMDAFADMYINNLQVGFEEDIAIWENKAYRVRPALCDGDGPIGKLRRWYRQFYE